ncbi:MAG: hypothetical protein KTR28_05250 [Micavibrio sp.]|nr:hypothetical protein [Micavibrio sp.]
MADNPDTIGCDVNLRNDFSDVKGLEHIPNAALIQNRLTGGVTSLELDASKTENHPKHGDIIPVSFEHFGDTENGAGLIIHTYGETNKPFISISHLENVLNGSSVGNVVSPYINQTDKLCNSVSVEATAKQLIEQHSDAQHPDREFEVTPLKINIQTPGN